MEKKMLEHNAVFAGVFASLASVFSKLALEDDAKTLKFVFQDILSGKMFHLLMIICIIMMILSNVLMWVLFTRSLHGHCTTAEATVTNSATNFICSALFGWLLFNESIPPVWWAGCAVMVCGLALIHTSTTSDNHDSSKHKKS